MKILVIDNYDSFTYNLVHVLESNSDVDVVVVRNDEISVGDVDAYQKIIISPGPGLPEDAGIIQKVIEEYASKKSILGVCLGHQGIVQVFGGKLKNLNQVYHGVATEILLKEPIDPLFRDLPVKFKAARYHSWIADADMLPEELLITAADVSGGIMGIRHQTYDLRGIQFHPESILTEHGNTIINNWIQI